MPHATIILPTCNRPADLRRCLQTLQPQINSEQCEVIVSDDSGDELTRQMMSQMFSEFRCIAGPRRGPAANRNLGAAQATGEWLIFIDDDVIPAPNFIQAYLDAFRADDGKDVYHGLTLPSPLTSSLLWEAPEVLKKQDVFPSCNFAIRRRLYEQAGGFDERFNPSFEDMEFFSRLQLQGIAFGFVAAAVVHHPRRALPTAKKLAKRWETRVISALDLGAQPVALAFLLTKHVLLVILSRFRGVRMSPDAWRAAAVFTGEFLWFLWLLPGWLCKHTRSARSPFWEIQRVLGKVPRRYGL